MGYDGGWGAISPSHAAFVARLAGLVLPGRAVLDAACGTGQYWPALLAAGPEITGTGQSAAMLAHAHRTYPEVPAWVLARQDLAIRPGPFNALLGVDALKYVAPRTGQRWWPASAGGGHCYPPRPAVRGWLAEASFSIAGQAGAEGLYWHLLLTRENPRPVRSARIPSSERPVVRAPAIPSRAPPL